MTKTRMHNPTLIRMSERSIVIRPQMSHKSNQYSVSLPVDFGEQITAQGIKSLLVFCGGDMILCLPYRPEMWNQNRELTVLNSFNEMMKAFAPTPATKDGGKE